MMDMSRLDGLVATVGNFDLEELLLLEEKLEAELKTVRTFIAVARVLKPTVFESAVDMDKRLKTTIESQIVKEISGYLATFGPSSRASIVRHLVEKYGWGQNYVYVTIKKHFTIEDDKVHERKIQGTDAGAVRSGGS